MLTDTILEDARWEAVGLPDLAERAARATLTHLGLDPAQFELAILGCDDARIATLNGDFRAKPTPTNVLSWPSEELAAETAGGHPDAPSDSELGDIAIAYDTCAREAKTADKTLQAHTLHLIVHGTLHCLGYDHVRDADGDLMEGLESAILSAMGEPDPYSDQ